MVFQRSQLIYIDFNFMKEPVDVQINIYLLSSFLYPKTRHSEERHPQSFENSHNEKVNMALQQLP